MATKSARTKTKPRTDEPEPSRRSRKKCTNGFLLRARANPTHDPGPSQPRRPEAPPRPRRPLTRPGRDPIRPRPVPRTAMRVDLFDFELPPELVAQAPARPRDAARLLLVD